MNRNKGKLSYGNRLKSSSLLTLSEIDALEKSSDWRKNYIIKPKEIGRGHFSKVYHVSCDNRKKSFAAKVIRRRKGGIDRLEKIKQEAALIRKLNAIGVESVIQLFETYENFSDVVLISELAKGGSLFKLVQESETRLTPDYVKIITYKLLLALEAMHLEGIVHLDIKADNILLREPYPSTDIALCDFGLATQLKEGKIYKELVGTPDYMAPEVINYEKVTVNADMWSVGVLVYYLLTGISPFMGASKDETLFNVSKVNLSFDTLFDGHDYYVIKDFILSLCIRSPELRLNSSASQQHEWLQHVREVELEFMTFNCDIKPLKKIVNDVHSSQEEKEEDIGSSEVSPLSRWQSVDLDKLDMSSSTSRYRTHRPVSLSSWSHENGDNNHIVPPNRLMHVEEVNDEVFLDVSESGTRRGSRASAIDVAGGVAVTPLRSGDDGDSRSNVSSGSMKRNLKEYSQDVHSNLGTGRIRTETLNGKGPLIVTMADQFYDEDISIPSDSVLGDSVASEAFLDITPTDNGFTLSSIVNGTQNNVPKTPSNIGRLESSSSSSSDRNKGCDSNCPHKSCNEKGGCIFV